MKSPTVDAVVLGSSPTGLYALRELAKAGFAVALADANDGCAFASRYLDVSRRFMGPVGAVDDWLVKIAEGQERKPVLIAANDVFIEFVNANADRLESSFRFAACHRGLADVLLDKSSFHALCQQHGVATPGVWFAEDRDALAKLQGEIPQPCILKPALIHRAKAFLKGQKVLLARDAAEFARHVASIPADTGGWLVQEVIPGPESEITLFGGYVDESGRARQSFTGRKLRQYPVGFGSASLVTSRPCQETLGLTLDFLQRIGFRGICGAEYKRDPRDGRLKIIEINPRPTLWFQIIHDAGLRIAEAAVADLGEGRAIAEAVQDESVCWRYGLKDAASARFYRRDRGRFVFPPPDVSEAASMRAHSWPVYAADDPKPALVEPLGYVRKAFERLR